MSSTTPVGIIFDGISLNNLILSVETPTLNVPFRPKIELLNPEITTLSPLFNWLYVGWYTVIELVPSKMKTLFS